MPSFVREESWNSVRVFWLEREKLLAALQKEAKRAGRKNKNVKKIVLFGSLARGRGVPGSDADILVLLKESDRPFLERAAEWRKEFDVNFPVDVFPYTEKESRLPFVRHALKTGILLYKQINKRTRAMKDPSPGGKFT